MSNLVIVSGDYCSGTTLLFTLFRQTGKFHCLYEPLHEKLPEYLIYGLRPSAHDHHFFVDGYFDEFRGFRRARALHPKRWGDSNLFLPPDAEADDLYRYLSYLVGTAFGRAPRVMFKENRIPFRLAWLRAKFPQAKIIHIYRPKEAQWKSVVRRVQGAKGREDVGQDRVDFGGFNIARWCEDLKGRFPELDARHFTSGFDRFAALWQLSYEANVKSADLSIHYPDLLRDFEATCERIWRCIGVTGIDTAALKRFVVTPEGQASQRAPGGLLEGTRALADRAMRKYAGLRLRAEAYFRRGDDGSST
jgi:sulfotransferase family protein